MLEFIIIICIVLYVIKKSDKEAFKKMQEERMKRWNAIQNNLKSNSSSNSSTSSGNSKLEQYKENYTENYKQNYKENYIEDYSNKVDCVHTDKAHIKELNDIKNKVDCVHDNPGYTGDKFDKAIRNNDNLLDRSNNPIKDTSTNGIVIFGERKEAIIDKVSGSKITYGNEDDEDAIKML